MNNGRQAERPAHCPARAELAEFATGRLAMLAAEAIADHLTACGSCRAVLEELEKQPDALVDELRNSVLHPPLDEATCARVAARVSAIGEDRRVKDGSGSKGSGMDRDTFQVPCPFCGTALELSGEDIGGQPACSECDGRFTLEAGETPGIAALTHRGTIAQFELLERLGGGSFGSVWKAHDTRLDRIVALKIPRPGHFDGEQSELFAREARAAAKVRHANIVGIYEVGSDNGCVYIVSDLIEGASLEESLDGVPVPAGEACSLCLSVAEALQAAHAAGIIHRDLKPANILIDREGRPYITDFGLAKQETDGVAVTVEGRLVGTPAYMPPEQARGKGTDADRRSDVYSLGVIMFELLTGEPPFRGDVRMLVSRILFAEPPRPRQLNDRIPRDVETICLKCLRKQPAHRYQSAGELAADLRRYLEGRPIHARPVGRVGRFWRWCRRKPALASVSAALGLLVVVATMALSAAYWKTSAALRVAERNLYFHQISAAQRKWLDNDRRSANKLLDGCPADRRAFEWWYLKRLFNTREGRLPRAGRAVAYSPDGRLIATAGGDEMAVKIWDAQSKELRHKLTGHTSYLTDLAFGPQGRLVVSAGGGDRTLRLWDAVEGKPIRIVGRYPANVLHSCFSPDGTRVLSCGLDRFLRVWETSTGKELLEIDLIRRRSRDLAVSPVDNSVAVVVGSGIDSTVTVWDYETGKKLLDIPTGAVPVVDVAFSPDGERLAVAESRGMIRIWQLTPLQQLLGIPAPTSDRAALTFDPKGQRIAAEAWDGSIRVWDATTGRELLVLRGHVPPARNICFSPDGQYLAAGSGDDVVHVWDTMAEPGTASLGGVPSAVRDLEYSPDGKLVAGAFANGMVKLWNTKQPGEGRLLARSDGDIWAICFSPDGRWLATAGEDAVVRVYDIANARLELEFTEHGKALRCVDFSPDSKRVASAGMSGCALVWDRKTGKVEQRLSATKHPIRSVAFHPDGTSLAVGARDARVTVWDIASGQELWQKTDIRIRVWNVAWSPDGRSLAVACGDGTVQLCDAADGKRRITFGDLAHKLPVDLAFSSDGNRLVTASARMAISLWEIPSGRTVLTLSRRPTLVGSVAFHPSGESIASAEIGGTIKLWMATPTK